MTTTARTLKLLLPYPPTINHYYVLTLGYGKGGKRYPQLSLGKEGRTFRKNVEALVVDGEVEGFAGWKRLDVTIHVWPPDRICRDVDNVQKATLDALQHAKVFGNDSQIDALHTYRRGVVDGGRVEVEITEIEQPQGEMF